MDVQPVEPGREAAGRGQSIPEPRQSEPSTPAPEVSASVPEQAAPDRGAPDPAVPDRGAPDRAVPDRAAPTSVPAKRRPWLRKALLIGLIAVSVSCLGGLVVAYVAYDKATAIDRTTPEGVLDLYLAATFSERNDERARLFTCGDPQEIHEIRELLVDLADRERRFEVKFSVTWAAFESTVEGNRATVTAELKFQASKTGGSSSRSIERWRFVAENRSGWRVCDAHWLDRPTPATTGGPAPQAS